MGVQRPGGGHLFEIKLDGTAVPMKNDDPKQTPTEESQDEQLLYIAVVRKDPVTGLMTVVISPADVTGGGIDMKRANMYVGERASRIAKFFETGNL